MRCDSRNVLHQGRDVFEHARIDSLENIPDGSTRMVEHDRESVVDMSAAAWSTRAKSSQEWKSRYNSPEVDCVGGVQPSTHARQDTPADDVDEAVMRSLA